VITVGTAVRLVRGLTKDARVWTYTVREIREDEARIDNGLPAVHDLQRNGFTAAACVPLKDLVPWDAPQPRVATAVERQERILALEAELNALRAHAAERPVSADSSPSSAAGRRSWTPTAR